MIYWRRRITTAGLAHCTWPKLQTRRFADCDACAPCSVFEHANACKSRKFHLASYHKRRRNPVILRKRSCRAPLTCEQHILSVHNCTLHAWLYIVYCCTAHAVLSNITRACKVQNDCCHEQFVHNMTLLRLLRRCFIMIYSTSCVVVLTSTVIYQRPLLAWQRVVVLVVVIVIILVEIMRKFLLG